MQVHSPEERGNVGTNAKKVKMAKIRGRVVGREAQRERGRHSEDFGVCVETVMGNSRRVLYGGDII